MHDTLGIPKDISPNPEFDVLFERGMDPNVLDPTKCHNHSAAADEECWPSIKEILEYREKVREAILTGASEVLALQDVTTMDVCKRDIQDLILSVNGRAFKEIAEHDLMHSETLLYMFASMESVYKNPPNSQTLNYITGASPLRNVGNNNTLESMVEIPHGPITAGADIRHLDFGWDCEFPCHQVQVKAFRVATTPTTNGQFRAFVESGAYNNQTYWTPLGWEWKTREKLSYPFTWMKAEDGTWNVRTAFEPVPFEDAVDWPIYVSQEEAAAFAQWKGKRLMTEVEYLRAAYASKDNTPRSYPWGEEAPIPGKHGNFDFYSYAPMPVGSCPDGASDFGVHELVGNGWEWTSTVFQPLAGFTPYMKSYKGYSADFYDGEHTVMLGASWATGKRLLRRSFRNWFQPRYQYVFSKFRLAEDAI